MPRNIWLSRRARQTQFARLTRVFYPFSSAPIRARTERSFASLKTHMAIPRFFRPIPELNDEERRRGLGNMTRQAISAAGADGLASGGFLASFALILGASNFHIGIMTAIPFIMQPLQLVAVLAVERLRLRKAVAVTAYFFAYATWIPIALLPFFIDVPNPTAVALMLVFIARMPEPKMIVPAGERPSVFSSLGAPFRDRNFRQLINFLFLWNFVA